MNFWQHGKLVLLIKIGLFLLLAWFIADRLFIRNDIHAQWLLFKEKLNAGRFYPLIAALALMPVNWLLETAKWKILLRTHVPFKALIKSVLAGITVGFVTPGRSGEFVGRVILLHNYSKTKGFYLSSMGGLAQTAASLVTGVPFVYMWSNNHDWAETTMGAAVVFLLAFFRFDLLNRLIASVPFLQRYGLIITEEDLPGISAQVFTLLLSFIRFFTYVFQYVLLLRFFGVDAGYMALTVHSIVYLLAQTFSPLMPLLDVSFRTGAALLIFKQLTANNLAVICAVMGVWLINLVIPAIAGYWFIFRKNEFKWAL